MALFAKKLDYAWLRAAPTLVRDIEAYRMAVVPWSEAATRVAQSPGPDAISQAEHQARLLHAAQSRAIASYNAWYDIQQGTEDPKYAVSAQALVMLGAKGMIQEIEVQVVCLTSLFAADSDFDTAATRLLDTDWVRYTMLYGPVDEHANGRNWKPGDIANFVSVASTMMDTAKAFMGEWGGRAGEILAAMRRGT